MKEVKIALIGFGNAGQAFAEMLLEQEQAIEEQYGARVLTVAILTKTRGNLSDPEGIDLGKALGDLKTAGRFDEADVLSEPITGQSAAEQLDYDVLIELTPLEFASGKTATDHIGAALKRGRHAITANKGPLAWSCKSLRDLAKANHCQFLYETTVMDGTPIFNLQRAALPLCRITAIKGILNSTTNYILEETAKGNAMEDIIAEGQKRGFVEADPADDIEGYDAAVKITVLANVLMDADLTPLDIDRKGIEGITKEDLDQAAKNGNTIKLLCSAYWEDGRVKGKVAPEEISKEDLYASLEGTSSVVTLTTDLMGTISVIEERPEIQQTAYGIFSDLLTLIRAAHFRRKT